MTHFLRSAASGFHTAATTTSFIVVGYAIRIVLDPGANALHSPEYLRNSALGYLGILAFLTLATVLADYLLLPLLVRRHAKHTETDA